METLKVTATAHGSNYLPDYLARDFGIFAEHGLEVPFEARSPWDGVMHDLADGTADVALGGLWVLAMYAGKGRDFVAVGQLNDRFPMAIVTREPVPDFELSWLRGKTALAPGQGGSAPAEFTRGLMREAGLNPWETRFAHDLSTQMLRELFVGGTGDAIIADLGTASELVAAGQGHISYQHADLGGRMPNSVYYVLRERLDELTPRLVPFVASIEQAMQLLNSGDTGDLTRLYKSEWPEADPAVVQQVTDRLVANGTWATTRIDRAAAERWTGMLHDAGLTTHHVTYDEIVDDRAMDGS